MCALSHVQLSATPWTMAHRAPLSMRFPRQEYRSGLPFPTPEDLPNSGMELTYLTSPVLAGGLFTTGPPRKPRLTQKTRKKPPLNTFIQFGLWNTFYLFDLGIYLFILYLLPFPREIFWKPQLISVPRYQSNQIINIKKTTSKLPTNYVSLILWITIKQIIMQPYIWLYNYALSLYKAFYICV